MFRDHWDNRDIWTDFASESIAGVLQRALVFKDLHQGENMSEGFGSFTTDELSYGPKVVGFALLGVYAAIGGIHTVDNIERNTNATVLARKQSEEHLHSLPFKEQADFVHARLAKINCSNAATQTPVYIDLPSDVPERDRIMGC
jgi:hypothetical protein